MKGSDPPLGLTRRCTPPRRADPALHITESAIRGLDPDQRKRLSADLPLRPGIRHRHRRRRAVATRQLPSRPEANSTSPGAFARGDGGWPHPGSTPSVGPCGTAPERTADCRPFAIESRPSRLAPPCGQGGVRPASTSPVGWAPRMRLRSARAPQELRAAFAFSSRAMSSMSVQRSATGTGF